MQELYFWFVGGDPVAQALYPYTFFRVLVVGTMCCGLFLLWALPRLYRHGLNGASSIVAVVLTPAALALLLLYTSQTVFAPGRITQKAEDLREAVRLGDVQVKDRHYEYLITAGFDTVTTVVLGQQVLTPQPPRIELTVAKEYIHSVERALALEGLAFVR